MRTIILIIFAICIAGTIKGQEIATESKKFDISLNLFNSIAVSEDFNTYLAKGGQISFGHDFSKEGFLIGPELDLNWVVINSKTKFSMIPSLKIGHNNFFAIGSYNLMLETPYYGVGGVIPITKNGSGISLQIQGGLYSGFAVGYASFGYTIKL